MGSQRRTGFVVDVMIQHEPTCSVTCRLSRRSFPDALFWGLKAARNDTGEYVVCGWVRKRDYDRPHFRYPLNRPFAVSYTGSRTRGADSVRYGYRRTAAMLRDAGWTVNVKRVERIWRREGLKVPQKQPNRGRLWLNDGSCIRLRPEYPTMFGPTTSSRIAPTMGGSIECSTSSMSSRENAWRSE